MLRGLLTDYNFVQFGVFIVGQTLMFKCRHKVEAFVKIIHVADIYGGFIKLVACNINNQSVFNILFFIAGGFSNAL